jgi:methionyl-tRNA formyltransferase
MSKAFPSAPLKKPMRLAFFGTPEFAAVCLRELHTGPHTIVAVVTAPDKKAGRGQQLRSSRVKETANELNLPLFQPTNLKDTDFAHSFRALDCDLAIVVAFRMLPESIWNAPRFGSINLHASLLPQLRGAAPIQWAIRHRLTETGVTTFALQHAIDTGDILLQAKVAIAPTETAASLHNKLLEQGKALLSKTIDALAQGELTPIAQQTLASNTHRLDAPKLDRTNSRINWSQAAENVEHMVRSLTPYPTAFCRTPWGDFKVLSVRHTDFARTLTKPGDACIADKRLFIACTDRWLELLSIVPIGKRAMEASTWINGLQPEKRESLGNWNEPQRDQH